MASPAFVSQLLLVVFEPLAAADAEPLHVAVVLPAGVGKPLAVHAAGAKTPGRVQPK